jgi:pimeloyl-ACP methyl ester carboxylesterase
MPRLLPWIVFTAALALAPPRARADGTPGALLDRIEHGYAEHDGVKIHFASLGEGPLVVMVHGFPDYWYTWRHQMEALASDFRVVAMDQRGYNLSDKPKGVASYSMTHLVGDVVAVIHHLGEDKAILVGHDWGAAVCWQVAMNVPDAVERLVILSVPHPAGFGRELTTNEEQRSNSDYARKFQEEGAHEALTAQGLASWVRNPADRRLYVEAFERSDFEAMLAYYKANYPRTGAGGGSTVAPTPGAWPRVKVPVLVLHGFQDKALHVDGHAGVWDWVEDDVTLVILRKSGHFLQHDESEKVSAVIGDWLRR